MAALLQGEAEDFLHHGGLALDGLGRRGLLEGWNGFQFQRGHSFLEFFDQFVDVGSGSFELAIEVVDLRLILRLCLGIVLGFLLLVWLRLFKDDIDRSTLLGSLVRILVLVEILADLVVLHLCLLLEGLQGKVHSRGPDGLLAGGVGSGHGLGRRRVVGTHQVLQALVDQLVLHQIEQITRAEAVGTQAVFHHGSRCRIKLAFLLEQRQRLKALLGILVGRGHTILQSLLAKDQQIAHEVIVRAAALGRLNLLGGGWQTKGQLIHAQAVSELLRALQAVHVRIAIVAAVKGEGDVVGIEHARIIT